MANSIKLKDNHYFDVSSIVNGRTSLNRYLFENMNADIRPNNNDINNGLIVGQYTYDPNTLNSPHKQDNSYDEYGIVVVISNQYDLNHPYRWVFQIALGTSGNIFVRKRINQGVWSIWKKFNLV